MRARAASRPGRLSLALVLPALALLWVTGGRNAWAQPAPIVSPGGPYAGLVGIPLTFTGTSSAAAGGVIVSYVWNFGDGGSAAGSTVQHMYGAAGSYTVVLNVVDSSGLSGSGATTASIGGQSGGCQGIPLAGPASGALCPSLSACATANIGVINANCGGIGGCTTIVGSSTPAFTACGAAAASAHVSAGGPYLGPAQQPLTLTGTASFTPLSPCPVAPAILNGISTCPTTGAPIPPLVAPVTYRWNFGDGQVGLGAGVSHAYTTAGSYSVTLSVSFSDGSTTSVETVATVTPPLPPRRVPLLNGCNDVALTFPDGTPSAGVAAAVNGSLVAIWAVTPSGGTLGWFPTAGAPSDLQTVNRLDAVFICLQGPGTLSEPGA